MQSFHWLLWQTFTLGEFANGWCPALLSQSVPKAAMFWCLCFVFNTNDIRGVTNIVSTFCPLPPQFRRFHPGKHHGLDCSNFMCLAFVGACNAFDISNTISYFNVELQLEFEEPIGYVLWDYVCDADILSYIKCRHCTTPLCNKNLL